MVQSTIIYVGVIDFFYSDGGALHTFVIDVQFALGVGSTSTRGFNMRVD